MTMQHITYKNGQVAFCQTGTGHQVVVLLHGYLEDSSVWGSFLTRLSENFKIVCIDLLGHGQTGVFSKVHTMQDMADEVRFVLRYLGYEKVWLLGHSMGGYVTLDFAYRYAEVLNGFILLHSSAAADTPDKQQARLRTIELIRQGKKALVTSEHVPATFAPQNITKFLPRIEKLKNVASQISDEAIIAALYGMKERIDRTDILRTFDRPILFIAGKHDNFIPFSVSKQQIDLSVRIQPLILEQSGHMGFIEEEKTVAEFVTRFIKIN